VLEACTNETCVMVNLTLSKLQNWIAKGGLIETKGFVETNISTSIQKRN
jgi:hypothetical protein